MLQDSNPSSRNYHESAMWPAEYDATTLERASNSWPNNVVFGWAPHNTFCFGWKTLTSVNKKRIVEALRKMPKKNLLIELDRLMLRTKNNCDMIHGNSCGFTKDEVVKIINDIFEDYNGDLIILFDFKVSIASTLCTGRICPEKDNESECIDEYKKSFNTFQGTDRKILYKVKDKDSPEEDEVIIKTFECSDLINKKTENLSVPEKIWYGVKVYNITTIEEAKRCMSKIQYFQKAFKNQIRVYLTFNILGTTEFDKAMMSFLNKDDDVKCQQNMKNILFPSESIYHNFEKEYGSFLKYQKYRPNCSTETEQEPLLSFEFFGYKQNAHNLRKFIIDVMNANTMYLSWYDSKDDTCYGKVILKEWRLRGFNKYTADEKINILDAIHLMLNIGNFENILFIFKNNDQRLVHIPHNVKTTNFTFNYMRLDSLYQRYLYYKNEYKLITLSDNETYIKIKESFQNLSTSNKDITTFMDEVASLIQILQSELPIQDDLPIIQ